MSLYLQENLNNLDAFWSALSYESHHNEIKVHSSWPHKVWHSNFQALQNQNDDLIKGKSFVTTSTELYADKDNGAFSLLAMAMPLENVSTYVDEAISQLKNHNDLDEWATACSQAFGYKIDTHALTPLLADPNATLFSYRLDDKIVGTAIAYKTDTVMGVHQVGVNPKYRGKGIAKCLMLHLAYHAKQQDAELITLQASKAGTPLYLKMGFNSLANIYHIKAL